MPHFLHCNLQEGDEGFRLLVVLPPICKVDEVDVGLVELTMRGLMRLVVETLLPNEAFVKASRSEPPLAEPEEGKPPGTLEPRAEAAEAADDDSPEVGVCR